MTKRLQYPNDRMPDETGRDTKNLTDQYHYADRVYRKYRLEDKLTDDFFYRTSEEPASL